MQNNGQRIKIARLLKGLTLERLAAYTGVSVDDLILIEQGFKPATSRQYFRLATILGIPQSSRSLERAAIEIRDTSPPLQPAQSETRVVLIIGNFFSAGQRKKCAHTSSMNSLEFLEAPNANKSFAMLGIGTSELSKRPVPFFIILDTDIKGELVSDTTQAFHAIRKYRHVPIFLTGTQPTETLRNMSNQSNVYGTLARPASVKECQDQLSRLIAKVEMLNSYF